MNTTRWLWRSALVTLLSAWLLAGFQSFAASSARTLSSQEMAYGVRGAESPPNCTHRVTSAFCDDSLCVLHNDDETDCKNENPLVCCNGTDRNYSRERCKSTKPLTVRDCTETEQKGKCGKSLDSPKCIWDATKNPKCFCSGTVGTIDCHASDATYSSICNPVVK